jgi:hypothetical protein
MRRGVKSRLLRVLNVVPGRWNVNKPKALGNKSVVVSLKSLKPKCLKPNNLNANR